MDDVKSAPAGRVIVFSDEKGRPEMVTVCLQNEVKTCSVHLLNVTALKETPLDALNTNYVFETYKTFGCRLEAIIAANSAHIA